MGDELVAHIAAVHIDVLHVGAAARRFGQAGAAVDAQRAGLGIDGPAVTQEFRTQHIGQARLHLGGTQLFHQLALMPDGEAHIGPGQGVAAYGLQAVGQLGALALEEFAACRGVEEKLAHLHAGALRAGGGHQLAAAGVQTEGVLGALAAAGQGHLGHRADGGQGLAAKTHGGHRLQLVQVADLAGGVALERQGQLLGRDAAAVVLHHDGAHAAAHELDIDLAGAGVQGVVHQLAHHGGRALHHLASGDLADQFIGEFADGPARGRRQRGRHINHHRIVRSPSRCCPHNARPWNSPPF